MRYFYTSVILLLTIVAQAQSDSVRTEYQTEDASISKSEVKRFIRYITRANVEEKTLIKLGIWPNTETNNRRSSKPLVDLGISGETVIERKLSPAFSLFAGATYSLGYVRYERILFNTPIPGFITGSDVNRNFSVTPKFGSRYYYAMASKVKEGKAANNFSGNYISVQAEKYLLDRSRISYYDFVTGVSFVGLDTSVDKRLMFSILWGVQRRLGRMGYVDFNVGPAFRFSMESPFQLPLYTIFREVPTGKSLSLQLNAMIGLGW